jgi:hypothetical protein
MSPDRLNRHDHPPDDAVVTWGELRQVGTELVRRFVRALHWLALALLIAFLVTSVTGGVVISKQGHNTSRVAQNTRNIQASSCLFLGVLEDSADRERSLAATARSQSRMAHVRSATYFESRIRLVRASGLKCPPHEPFTRP